MVPSPSHHLSPVPGWGQRTMLCLLCHLPLATGALLSKTDPVSSLLNYEEFLVFHDIFVACCRSCVSPLSSPRGPCHSITIVLPLVR